MDLHAYLDTVEERKRNEMVQTEITDFFKASEGSGTYYPIRANYNVIN